MFSFYGQELRAVTLKPLISRKRETVCLSLSVVPLKTLQVNKRKQFTPLGREPPHAYSHLHIEI
jgi:hypothetical protein